jgi:uncharacterized protein (TIGR00266 family)
MEFEILGGQLPYVVCKMKPGEKMVSESGGLHFKTPGVGMETSMKGGLLGGLTRSLQGESAFLNIFTASKDNDEIAFSSSFPGQIVHFKLEAGQHIIAQKGAFLAGSDSVKLSMHFKKKLGVGLFGGEGFILNKIEGPGDVFLEIDGALAERNLAAGETILVDTGHVALFEPAVQYDVEMMKGFKNIFFGGEGLFLAKLTGPGKIWIQSLSSSDMAKAVQPFMPSK